MSGFGDVIITAARLKMLQLLAAAKGYSLNNQILQTGLESMGLHLSGDQVRTELGWLAEQRTITSVDAGTMIVAELTERGHDVAKGSSELRGIDRPVPGSGL